MKTLKNHSCNASRHPQSKYIGHVGNTENSDTEFKPNSKIKLNIIIFTHS